MTRTVLAIVFHLSLTLTVVADDATLTWKNGDRLAGTLLNADGNSLTWRSAMFKDPLQIETSYLDKIKFPESETSNPGEPEMQIIVQNGDSLSGQLKSMTETTMSFESRRFGAFTVARDQIVGLQRTQNSGVIYSGPRGLNEWQAAFRRPPNVNNDVAGRVIRRKPRKPANPDTEEEEKIDNSIWFEDPDGSLTTKKPDASLFLPLNLPKRFEIDVEVRSTKPLSFLMAMGRDAKNSLRIETWVDELVAANKSFAQLKTIGEKDLSIHLYAFVDQTANTMLVYADTGEKLGEISIEGNVTKMDGLMFRNGDFDLSIRRVRVNHWDGETPRLVSGDDSRIELTDGTQHFGKLQAFDAESGTLTLAVEEKPVAISIAEIASLMNSGRSSAAEPERGSTWLSWHDGSFISGLLVSASEETVILKTDYTVDPIQCSRDNLRQMGLGQKSSLESTAAHVESAGKYVDRLFHDKGTLLGQLLVEGAADAPIQWTPLGGMNTTTLQGVENARFVRGLDAAHFSQHAELRTEFPDILYLKNNDVLPCRIEACSEESIEFTSPLTEIRSFTREHIRAIELTAAGRIHQSGFGAKGWKGLSDKQKTDDGKLEFRGNINYSHPEILTGDTVRFRLNWPKEFWASLTVSMYGNGRRDDEECTHVCFFIQQNSLQVLDRPMQPNQVMMGMGRRAGGRERDGLVAVKNSQADVQLVAHEGNIVVSINGDPVKTIKMNSAAPGRRGIAFNANVTMADRQVIVNGRAQQRAGNALTLTNFEVDNLSGASIRQFIEEESRQAALTIPRFRRDNPPTHVLIAPNGDLLRGRMQAIDGNNIVFESRLETLRFDRSRVRAVVWLDPPEKVDVKDGTPDEAAETTSESPGTQPVPAAEGLASEDEAEMTMQAQLVDGFSITMKPLRLVDGRIEGTSRLLGKCSFPARQVRELSTGNPGNNQRLAAYDTWVTKMAREPDWDIPQSDGGNSQVSALVGTTATDFELPMLDGTTFKLSEHQDKIVVLDFWATWCGPCVAALPDYIAATSKFDESKVIFVAVNLQEPSDQIRLFLNEKQLLPLVALDRSAAVATTFQVSGIPHTVILGPGNVFEDIHIGYQPGSGEAMETAIQQMLDGTWKRPVQNGKTE